MRFALQPPARSISGLTDTGRGAATRTPGCPVRGGRSVRATGSTRPDAGIMIDAAGIGSQAAGAGHLVQADSNSLRGARRNDADRPDASLDARLSPASPRTAANNCTLSGSGSDLTSDTRPYWASRTFTAAKRTACGSDAFVTVAATALTRRQSLTTEPSSRRESAAESVSGSPHVFATYDAPPSQTVLCRHAVSQGYCTQLAAARTSAGCDTSDFNRSASVRSADSNPAGGATPTSQIGLPSETTK